MRNLCLLLLNGILMSGLVQITTSRGEVPRDLKVFVSMDDAPKRLFAAGASGTQAAPWIMSGHKYLFTLEDSGGRELARDIRDLRQPRRR